MMEFAVEFGKTITNKPVKKIFEEESSPYIQLNNASFAP